MRISAVYVSRDEVGRVTSDLEGIGIGGEQITVNDYAGATLQDTLEEEYEEMSFMKAEADKFMDVRPFLPPVDVIKNTVGLLVSVEINPERKVEVEEILNRHQPKRVFVEDA